MDTTTTLYGQLVNEFENNQSSGKDLFSSLKNEAFNLFKENGFPTVKQEEWRFTNVLPFLKDEYVTRNGQLVYNNNTPSLIPGLDAYEIVLFNGKPVQDKTDICKGVHVASFAQVADKESFLKHLGKHAGLKDSPFMALNTAFLSDGGLFIEIDRNVVVDKPIHIINVYEGNHPLFIQPRHLIVAHENSRIQLIESNVINGTDAVFVNGVTECVLEDYANVAFYTLQAGKPNSRFVNFIQVSQQANSVYNNYNYILPSAGLVRNNLHIALEGSYTETHLYGLYLAGKNQLVDNHTKIDHKQPHCLSNELYKGVLMENARSVFNGKVYVHRPAQKTNAFQQNNNLLLSKEALVDSKPQLEIFADDVKCSHGSTVGNFNKEALFYLQSRGIGKKEATNLLVNAFAFDVTNKIEIPAVREYVEELIMSNMN